MAITPPPPPPNSSSPQSFNDRADAFLGWMPGFASELNLLIPQLAGGGWATYGGTANAITLTAGYTSLPVGTMVRFRAAAANTGAATLDLDGTGAKPCRTVTGVALPAGYIRTDADTVAVYDGTGWVLDRQVERGKNANGDWMRLADGTQMCTAQGFDQNCGNASGSVWIASTEANWTFPAAFAPGPAIACAGSVYSGNRWANVRAKSVTTALVRQFSPEHSATLAPVIVSANGAWY